jgi:hypothetical protein
MAFPQVANTSTGSTAADTSHSITLPANIVAGNLLMVFFATDGDNTITNWGGFTELFSESNGTAASLHVGYKTAVGSDTLTITTSVSEPGSYACYRITGHSTSQIPEVSTGQWGINDINPNPDSLTPTGGAKDYLWIAVEGNDDKDTVAAWPLPDNNLEATGGSNGDCNIGVCSDELNQATLDPGTFTLDNAEQWVACTVAVHPVAGLTHYDIVPDPGAFSFAGTAADLLRGYLIVPGVEAFLLAGTDTTLSRTREIVPSAGAFGLTGSDADLLRGYEVIPGTVNFPFAGASVNLKKGYNYSVDPASFTWAGTAADLLKGYEIIPLSGTFALAGQNTDLLYHRIFSVDTANFALTGTATDLLKGYMVVPGVGAFPLTGTDADLLLGRLLSAGTVNFPLVGFDATLTKSVPGAYTLEVNPGAFGFAGFSVTLTYTSTSVVAVDRGAGYGKRVRPRLWKRIDEEEEVFEIVQHILKSGVLD